MIRSGPTPPPTLSTAALGAIAIVLTPAPDILSNLTACSPISPPLDQPWAEALIGRSYEARRPEPRPQHPHLVVVGCSACGGGFGQVAFTELQISRPTSERSGVGFSRLASPPRCSEVNTEAHAIGI